MCVRARVCIFVYALLLARPRVCTCKPVSLLLAVWDAPGDEDTSVCVQVFMCRSGGAFWEEKD